ncbi:unnamed protein product [Brassicogethes aeneus]|uniref:SIAH-type domain-containing protein n=1 Tax=Brassicogethes aeneus TaxID=1431903 RepID=A0A9P0AU48_BRAAE|nr:unnamed protein product [Brassicogethes aeneus]
MARNYYQVSDSILKDLCCVKCQKYLTVGPIGFDGQGGNTCGRCLCEKRSTFSFMEFSGNPLDFENQIPMTLMSYASSPNIRFPCVNRYEGCNELIPFCRMREHEEICAGFDRKCLNCDYLGVGTQLIQHYKNNHKHLLITNKPFVLDLTGNHATKYLHANQNNIFCVTVKYTKNLNQFVVETLSQSPCSRLGRISLTFYMKSFYKKPFQTITLKTDLLDINENKTLNISFMYGDYHIDDFDKMYCLYKVLFE